MKFQTKVKFNKGHMFQITFKGIIKSTLRYNII